jgi:hypothetical protein
VACDPCCAALLAGWTTLGHAADASDPAPAPSLDRVPVILIPGLLGSRLARSDTGVELWPGSTRKLLTSDYEELALRIDPETLEPIDDGLVPSGIFEGAAGKDFYRQIMQELRDSGGYRLAHPGQRVGEEKARLYVFTYDWRQDNVRTVQKLDELIEQIRRDYDDPTLRVDVIAHSMGGLVVQYFERYGTADVLGGNSFQVTGLGLAKLRRIVLLGTPNQGTVTAVHKFLNGYRVGFSGLPTEGVATMPSTFQLFPHPLVDWVVNINGQKLNFDIFDVEFWRTTNGRSSTTASSAAWTGTATSGRRRTSSSAGSRSARSRAPLRLVADGACGRRAVDQGSSRRRLRADTASARFRERRAESVARLRPEQILAPRPGVDYESLMFAPGDGSVTLSSLLSREDMGSAVPRWEQATPEAGRELIVCARHDALTSDADLLRALIQYLLAPNPAPATTMH